MVSVLLKDAWQYQCLLVMSQQAGQWCNWGMSRRGVESPVMEEVMMKDLERWKVT